MEIKSIIVILLGVFISSSYAGVGVVTPEIEARALKLWQQFCDGQSEGGQDGPLTVYCKRARGAVKQSLKHTAEIGSSGPSKDQVVFVQPPSYHYKHDVVVTGGGVAARKTVIYVKPAKNTHEVNIKDQTAPGEGAKKPTVFFLKGSHGGDSITEKDGQTPTPPPATYLPPSTTQPPATYLPPSKPTQGYSYDAPHNPLQY